MPDEAHSKLPISFHGRIIDHFGVQMYQRPVAAIAELVSNSWDAEAESVEIQVPPTLTGPTSPTIVVKDNGVGMTFEDCEEHYLRIGHNTRGNDPVKKSPRKLRPILGRKGIGKFAGFGIARTIRVETISKETGEKTVFEMDAETLRGTTDSDDYVAGSLELDVEEYEYPDEERKERHGTRIVLKNLLLKRGMNPDEFARSMSRRFLLHQQVADFAVSVNGKDLPEGEDLEDVEFVFPKDYKEGGASGQIAFEPEDGEPQAWGVETLPGGDEIRWRFVFTKKPIDKDGLRGIAVFTNGKLAQEPFLFNLVGGLGVSRESNTCMVVSKLTT